MTRDELLSGHGGRIDAMARAFPDAPLPWLDLSTGINPFPYPLPPIAPDAWTRLPTSATRDACEIAMARAFGCTHEACRAVAGTEVAIRQFPAILRAQEVALRVPSYADHVQSWKAAGARIAQCADPLECAGAVDIAVIVNPNNPDGYCWPVDRIEAARVAMARRGGWLIVDEAYGELDPQASVAHLAGRDGLIVLRSFGKFYGLAGVRLGAVLAPPEVLAALDRRLGGWDVSGPALALGAIAYADADWANATRAKLAGAMRDCRALLLDAGLEDIVGTDLFRYVRAADAAGLWQRLARAGIAVRRFADDAHHLRFGLPDSQASLERLSRAISP